MSVDTACSSSLVAMSVGEQYLMQNCVACMVEGVNLILGSQLYFHAAGMLSPDSRCKTFDSSANGYVRSEGCVAVVISHTKADTELVACKVNQDGRSGGLTVPNKNAQRELLCAARAGLPLGEDIDTIEAHGTGTALGDPVEVSAIEDAYRYGKRCSQLDQMLHRSLKLRPVSLALLRLCK